jgi:hypothetical protein
MDGSTEMTAPDKDDPMQTGGHGTDYKKPQTTAIVGSRSEHWRNTCLACVLSYHSFGNHGLDLLVFVIGQWSCELVGYGGSSFNND